MKLTWKGILVALATVPVIVFMLLPVLSTISQSFNVSEYGGFPFEGLTTRWYAQLLDDDSIFDALKASLTIGVISSVISTLLATAAAYSVSRYWTNRKQVAKSFFTAPILVPHIVLAVGVLILFNLLSLPKDLAVLICGHTAITIPFVFSTMLARFDRMPVQYEEAAASLGASPLKAIVMICLPIAAPAIIASGFFAFSLSFDETTATMFWKPANIDTVPTLVLGMLQDSINPSVDALATLLIAATICLPLLGLGLRRILSAGSQT